MSDPIDQLTSLFERFPGIGPRQAGRFVHFLLRSSPSIRHELINAIEQLGSTVHQCPYCMRFHATKSTVCGICANPNRDPQLLAIIATDADMHAIERSGRFRGYYFILGGTISLGSDKTERLRTMPLIRSLPERIEKGLKEIILAFPANTEGDLTAAKLKDEMEPHILEAKLKITTLGRGLSTGSELEYADPDTIAHAIQSRH